ncbi:MAG: glucuronyl hydrolase, partial [Chitinophagia bacterium]
MKFKFVLLSFFILMNTISFSQSTTRDRKMSQLITENYALANSQYLYMMKQVPSDRMPQSFDEKNNKLLSREITWWCSGFYPGSLLFIYEQTKDEVIKAEALRTLKVIEPNQTYTGNHDLGFMMYNSFGNAYR